MHKTKNDIPDQVRSQLVQLLNDRLADAIDLQLQAKQAHWNVKGPSFFSLHAVFDGVAEALAGFADTIAERAVALGGIADGTIGGVARRTRLPDYPVGICAGRDHVMALSTALASFGSAVRTAIDQAAELKDADTADLFTEVSRGIDKKLWFVEAHLQSQK
jgi:starvation-inducible DNA-binding protein